jgi:hypothetical protein
VDAQANWSLHINGPILGRRNVGRYKCGLGIRQLPQPGLRTSLGCLCDKVYCSDIATSSISIAALHSAAS